MIRAMMFDLDGVVVQSEKLKAQAYAKAVQQLRGLSEPAARAVEAYRTVVGSSREEAAQFVVEELGLEPDLRPLMEQYGVSEPHEVLTEIRTAIYDEMVADPRVLRENQWLHTIELLRIARKTGCRTGLATSSKLDMTTHALQALELQDSFDLVLTREDVERPKPDPEIYLLAADRFGVAPDEMLVVEDSANGVRAAVAAGTNVIAFATPFTAKSLHETQVVLHDRILHESSRLLGMVDRLIEEHRHTDTPGVSSSTETSGGMKGAR